MHILNIAFVNEQERRFRRRGQVIPGLFIDPKMVYYMRESVVSLSWILGLVRLKKSINRKQFNYMRESVVSLSWILGLVRLKKSINRKQFNYMREKAASKIDR